MMIDYLDRFCPDDIQTSLRNEKTQNNISPAVSVIVPIYQVEEYLPRCIESILAQSFPDFELILVDDGSPDRCGEICDSYARRDKRITVIHQANRKLSAARNAGMDRACGTWLAFVDADDWVHRDFLRLLLNAAREDTDVVFCNCVRTDQTREDEMLAESDSQEIGFGATMESRIRRVRVWGRLYRRKTVGNLRFASGAEPAEDSCFNTLLLDDTMHFRVVPENLYFSRPESASRSHKGRGMLNAVSHLMDGYQKVSDPGKRQRIIERCHKNVFIARCSERFSPDYEEVKRRCKDLLCDLKPYRRQMNILARAEYELLTRAPILYRLFRIADDPSLIRFERTERQGKRNAG